VVCIEYDPWSAVFRQVAWSASRLPQRPRVVALVKKNTYRRLPTVLRWAKAMVAKGGLARADMIVAASARTRDLYLRRFGVPSDRVVVQPHLGVDTSHFAPNRPGRKMPSVVVGFVGNLSAVKGVPDLVGAVERLRALDRTVTLALLGPVRDEESALAIAGKDWITVAAPRPNHLVVEFLQTIDIFAMPTRVLPDHEEHDARALLEAMSCGLASVVTTSGIMPEIVDDRCGRLCPPNDPEALADAIAELAADPALRDELGARARERVVRHVDIVEVGGARHALFSTLAGRTG
jgi:glycosyltransferase involved in cell wall biosynthesis